MIFRGTVLTLLALLSASTFAALPEIEINALIAGLKSPQASVRVKNADRIQQLDRVPAELMPALFDLVLTKPKTGDPRENLVGLTAIHFGNLALAKLGKQAVPRLRELMRNPQTRWEAVGVLKRIGPDSGDAVPELIIALADRNENVRSLAVDTLNLLQPQQIAPAVDALIPLLKDRNENVQEGAISALGTTGAAAAKALPELKKLQKKKYSLAESYATEAIEKIEAGIREKPGAPSH